VHKQLFTLLLCFALIVPGSSFITGLNAQTKTKRAARTPQNPKKPTKNPSPEKKAGLANLLAAKKSGNVNLGDPCNTAAPIALGQTIDGSLATGDCTLGDGTFIDFYSFSGTAGQPVYVSMTSGAIDTYLFLIDDLGNVIDENDDSGDGTDSRIPADGGIITLPYTGEYIIGANSFSPESGSYSLSLNTDAACVATTIAYNQTVNGTLTTSDCAVNIGSEPFYTDLYKFNGTAGQQVSILMTSTAVDAYLILHTPSGEGSLEDDDSGGGTDARIPESGTFTLPETGTYTIEASTSTSFEVGAYTLTVTGPTVVPTANKPFDYDGDGKADVSVFRPSEGRWYILNSGTTNSYSILNFGLSTDKITPADFDGDGKTDLAVFRPSNGTWYVLNSSTNIPVSVKFGTNGDIPVPGDFDGDDKADFAVYRPSTGTWWVLPSSNGIAGSINFGTAEDNPLIGDFDGDGKSDISVYRPSTNTWYILNSSNVQIVQTGFGLSGDIATPADFDGDGKADIAVYRPSEGNWYILNSSNGSISLTHFGLSEDKPIAADYDGDGKADIAVIRPSTNTWYLLQSTAGFGSLVFGLNGDVATPNAFIR